MYEELEEKAIENLKAKKSQKKSVYVVGVIFIAVSILLYIVSLNFHSTVAYWIKFPILVLALVYAIIYFSVFGFPFLGADEELTEEEIEREIVKIYKQRGVKNDDPQSEEDALELKEIEALRNKWEDDEEYV